MTAWHWIFWLSALFFVYTYLGYPLLLGAWRLLAGRRKAADAPESTPRVTVVITVRNEAAHIERKLRNLLEQDYPADRMEIRVLSDCSTDGTDEVVRKVAAEDPRVRLVAFSEHTGKSPMLNQTIPGIETDVLVLADARQLFAPDAIRKLVRHFEDPKVGIVGAEMTLVDAGGEASGDAMGVFWRYERAVRRLESDLGLLTGISGPLYAMRPAVYEELPDTLVDDVFIVLYARRKRWKVLWDPEARLYEEVRTMDVEFGRKVRHLVGCYQMLCHFWPLCLPWRGRLAFTLLSHKLFRLFIPLDLALLLAASLALAPTHPIYLAAAAAQVAVYAAGSLSLVYARLRAFRLVSACSAFCVLNWAALVALVHVLRHGPKMQWR